MGYFKKSKKLWLLSNEDLNDMYKDVPPNNEISLWCDGRQEKEEAEFEPLAKRSRKSVDDTFDQLKAKHGNTYSIPFVGQGCCQWSSRKVG